MVRLTRVSFEAAQPLLDLLPDPAVLIGSDGVVRWRNQKATEEYGGAVGRCFELAHGQQVPCDQTGETCPRHHALATQSSASAMHTHRSTSHGQKFYRVLAVPVEDDSVLEIHYELGQGLLHDDLTGLYRRERWFEIVRRDQALLRRIHRSYAVVFIDLDEFKKFNDAFGHLAGDEMLRQIGAALAREVRASDTACRWGGEEFVLFLPGTTLAQALLLAERIRAGIRALRVETRAGPQRITASLGVFAAAAGFALEAALERADAALYAAKRAGRDRVVAQGERDGGEAAAAEG